MCWVEQQVRTVKKSPASKRCLAWGRNGASSQDLSVGETNQLQRNMNKSNRQNLSWQITAGFVRVSVGFEIQVQVSEYQLFRPGQPGQARMPPPGGVAHLLQLHMQCVVLVRGVRYTGYSLLSLLLKNNVKFQPALGASVNWISHSQGSKLVVSIDEREKKEL